MSLATPSASPPPSGLRTSPESSDQKLAALLRWLEDGGARFPKLNVVRQENGERAVLARTDIATGEAVLQVPRSHLLTLEVAKSSDIGRLIRSHVSPDNEELYLASFLLQEKHRPDSFWKPYVDSLPEAFPHVPLFFSASERALLQGSFLLTLLQFQDYSLRQDHALLCQKVPGYERFSVEEFIWARLSVSSRNFGLKVGGLQGRSLVPLADMLNHRRPPDVLWSTSKDGQFFEMTAQNTIATGLEVHDSYGAKSNDLLLLHFGFVVENNEQDEVFLSLGLPEGTALASGKQKLLGLSSPTARQPFKVPLQYEHAATQRMFSFLRVACATTGELPRLAPRLLSGLGSIKPLGVANEERVLRSLGEACEARLAAFDSSFEEDERLLREGALSLNARSCVLMRREEKRLLRAWLELTRTGLSLLRMPRAELERLAERPESPWGWFDRYVREAVLELVRRA
ncbi:SET domain-containing histone-lysine N-methyltransferase [Archangium lansingense]|uniref:SET domain-containing histone-lysine N-methyltransferase n=1 Tax=Archangium lansingense TaxID=2995310 RepID=UPI003B7720A6